MSTAQFCKDAAAVTQMADGAPTDKVSAAMDHLAAEAPAELKDDLAAITSAMHRASSGGADESSSSAVTAADRHMSEWTSSRC